MSIGSQTSLAACHSSGFTLATMTFSSPFFLQYIALSRSMDDEFFRSFNSKGIRGRTAVILIFIKVRRCCSGNNFHVTGSLTANLHDTGKFVYGSTGLIVNPILMIQVVNDIGSILGFKIVTAVNLITNPEELAGTCPPRLSVP